MRELEEHVNPHLRYVLLVNRRRGNIATLELGVQDYTSLRTAYMAAWEYMAMGHVDGVSVLETTTPKTRTDAIYTHMIDMVKTMRFDHTNDTED